MKVTSEKLTFWQKLGYGVGDFYGGGAGTLISFFYLVFLLWQTYYAILTARTAAWGTRPATAGMDEPAAVPQNVVALHAPSRSVAPPIGAAAVLSSGIETS